MPTLISNTDENIFRSQTQAYIFNISKAIEGYHFDNGAYPSNLEQLVPKYISEIRKNPWGENYDYYLKGDKAIVLTIDESNAEELIYRVHKKGI